MAAYYNEIDPFAAQWLRELIKAGLIADGEVDERSIADVTADDVRGFVQCHFFAGIGGWSYALRLAGWPDDRLVWTGSCPCQPWSAAGRGTRASDHRDLWPTWFQLIRQCCPVVCFGEQVSSADGLAWFDRVSDDLEGESYSIGQIDLPACSVGAPHIRNRLFFVADRASGQARSAQSEDRMSIAAAHWQEYIKQAGRCCSDHNRQVRRAPPGVLLVADGISTNVARVSGFGNAIVPQVAQAFIESYLEATA